MDDPSELEIFSVVLRDLELPDFKPQAFECPEPLARGVPDSALSRRLFFIRLVLVRDGTSKSMQTVYRYIIIYIQYTYILYIGILG